MKPSVFVTVAVVLGMATSALAITDQQKCEKAKLQALGKRSACIAKAQANEAIGKTGDFAKCESGFTAKLAKADSQGSCRWLEEGDGTARDLNSGCWWELKTGTQTSKVNCVDAATCSDPHDINNGYRWSTTGNGGGVDIANGEAFTVFLAQLNAVEAASPGSTETGCFAGKCAWRLPTAVEFAAVVATFPGTLNSGDAYWSATTMTSQPFNAFGFSGNPGGENVFKPFYNFSVAIFCE